MTKVRVKAEISVVYRGIDREKTAPDELAKRLRERLDAATRQDGAEVEIRVEAADG